MRDKFYKGGNAVTRAEAAGPGSPVDVRAIRKASGLTQQAFAKTYGFTVGALRDWEQGRKQPERTTRVLLRMISEAPDAVARVVSDSELR
jgi:putative transcriptional regulator